jgi:NHL repeat-containing protein
VAALAACVALAGGAAAVLRSGRAAPEPVQAFRWRETARVGTATGEGPLSFGVIGDLAADGHGAIYALDVVRKRVVAVTVAGEALGAFGREGHGPGEFEDPVALALDDAGRLYVLDRVNHRVEVLAAAPAGLDRVGGFPVDFWAEDLCVLGGQRLFLLGERGGHLIHEIDPADGRVLRSFARDTAATDILMQSYRTRGYLLCGPGDEVAFLPLLRPEVQRFSPSTGSWLGTAKIPGYRAVRVRRLANGDVRFSAQGGVHDFAGSIAALPGGGRLIQVGRLRRGATTRHEFESLRSYELSPRDHEVREVAVELPRVLTIRGATALAAVTDPFSAVSVLNLDPDPGGPR